MSSTCAPSGSSGAVTSIRCPGWTVALSLKAVCIIHASCPYCTMPPSAIRRLSAIMYGIIGDERKRVMVSIQMKARVGPDGILRLEVPTIFRDTEVDACVVLQPITTSAWPSGFFEATAGKWVGEL